jgi:hypothetical protein
MTAMMLSKNDAAAVLELTAGTCRQIAADHPEVSRGSRIDLSESGVPA